MNNISVLGLGWLGKPLALYLQKKGFKVNGSCTSLSKKSTLNKEIETHFIQLEWNAIQGDIAAFLKNTEILIINIPPKIKQDDESTFVLKMKFLLRKLKAFKIQKVIYVSSTSVFEDNTEFLTYTERDTPNARSKKALQLIEAEQLFLNEHSFKTAIVRFGGLVGEDRHPVFYLSGRSQLANSKAPVNLIHRKDCIQLIYTILLNFTKNSIYHGVYSDVLPKEKFYQKAAKARKLIIPKFSKAMSKGKKISSHQTELDLQLYFKHSVY
ncbi:hypothetical protein [Psychroflexus salis]|uniref:Epimerase n=1 Tax=Psychroflexus salis TaxID=1526574 RepID=A0A916ZN16_9FLAO|nr:hypothetical protein [Psychroflexus salis]GGE05483.1 epimerase [Psychroflexus salis]